MTNEVKVEGFSNSNTKVIFFVSAIFLIIASISVYSYFQTKNLNLSNNNDNLNSQVSEKNQVEIDRMNAELDAIRAGRPSAQVSLKEQVKSMDALRNQSLKKQSSSVSTDEQQKELERLKSSTVNN